MTSFEIYSHDQVEFHGVTYERYLLGGGGPEHGMLNCEGEWFQYTRDWFQPAVVTSYVGAVAFDHECGSMLLDNY